MKINVRQLEGRWFQRLPAISINANSQDRLVLADGHNMEVGVPQPPFLVVVDVQGMGGLDGWSVRPIRFVRGGPDIIAGQTLLQKL